ncbi:hypothetical protein HZB05_02220 [Candidatus Wolfebacteria bacterium]|nr:hypothetical protein [Candidatus Wolfebacteria bacterium]
MRNGYLALTSAIIISILILTISLSLEFSGFFARFNILDSEYKEKSLALADACADKALLKIIQNASYSGSETITIGNNLCNILPIETLSNQKTIKTSAVYQNAASNIKVIINMTDFSIISWEELPEF